MSKDRTAERRNAQVRFTRRFGRVLRFSVALVAVAGGAAATAACPNAGESRVLSIPGTGLVGGVVYLDVDGNRQAGGPDNGLQNVRVRLVVAGTGDTVARATSDANGTFVLGSVPVGRYTVVLPGESVFGDTIAIVRIDTADVSLNPDDTVQVQVAVSYPKVTIAEARQLPLGTKVFIEGVALNSLPTFGDTTVCIEDTTGRLRVTGVRGPLVALGDSVRFLGKMAARDGQPVLDGAQATVLVTGPGRPAETVTTAVAATADGGRLDAALVKVVDGTIGTDTATVSGDYVFSLDDGSGPVTVVFDKDAGLTRTGYVPGTVIDATGLLVPDGAGAWRLKPRTNADVQVKAPSPPSS
jgi:hypothetical protein